MNRTMQLGDSKLRILLRPDFQEEKLGDTINEFLRDSTKVDEFKKDVIGNLSLLGIEVDGDPESVSAEDILTAMGHRPPSTESATTLGVPMIVAGVVVRVINFPKKAE